MKKNSAQEIANDTIEQDCLHCSQSYLVKYWDAELDWYIELNSSSYCLACAEKAIKTPSNNF